MAPDKLSDEFVLSVIRTSNHFQELEKETTVSKINVNVLSEDGYLSVVYNVNVFFENETEFAFIVKRPSLSRYVQAFCLDDDKAHIETLATFHNRECQVYQILAEKNTIAPQLYASKEIKDLTKDPGYLVMESFVGKAEVFGMFTQITDRQCLNMAHQLGKLRAEISGVSTDRYRMLSDTFRLETDMLYNLMVKNTPFLLEYDYKIFSPLVEKLKPFVNKTAYAYLMKERAKELGVDSLTHADLHGGNLIVKTQPDGTPSNEIAAFIDWQTGFCGNALFDLARFVSFADPDTRRRVEKAAVDEYYNAYLHYVDVPDPKFTRKVCQELYDLGLVMEALEWQNFFDILTGNLTCDQHERDAIKARTALKARFVMEDSISLIKKYNLEEVIRIRL